MENNTENAVTETNSAKYLKLKALATKTQDEIADEILSLELRNANLQESIDISRRSLIDLRDTIHTFFEDRFDGGDDDVSITKEEANELLTSCGCDELESEFTVTLTVEVRLSVTANNEDTAIDMAKDSLSIDNDDTNVVVNDWEVTEDSAEKSDY